MTLRIYPVPTKSDIEFISEMISFYKGIGSINESGIIQLFDYEEFNLRGFTLSLNTSGFKVENF